MSVVCLYLTKVTVCSLLQLVRIMTQNKQVAGISQTDRAGGWVKVEDWNWETIFYEHYRSIFNHCDVNGHQSNRIWLQKMPNIGYYAVQGHSR